MWLSHPINPSKYQIVRRFDLIVAIAKVMRGCHFYYVSAPTHRLYGIAENGAMIREVVLPGNMEVSTSFIFRLDTIDKDILSTYVDFALLDDMPWALFPLIKYEEFEDYQPMFKPVTEYKLWTVTNKRSRLEVEFLDLYGVDGVKSVGLRATQTLIDGFMASRGLLSEMEYRFPNMERHLTVQNVFSSKASMGERYLHLQYDDRKYGIYLFKNLFTFNKNDGLTIGIRDRIDNPNLFEARFTVKHDKNPIKFIIDGDFIENTHATFVKLT